MKFFIWLFSILGVLSFLCGCFGRTPLGEPATHQLWVSMFSFVLAIVFYGEYKSTKSRKNSTQFMK